MAQTPSEPLLAPPPPPLDPPSTILPVLLVEDHPVFRYGLRLGLQSNPGLRIDAECASAREALAALRQRPFSVAIVDLSLPGGMDGLELTKCIHCETPRVLTLVLSVQHESLYALRAISAGARGYLMKDSPLEQIHDGIRRMLRGELALSARMTQRLAQQAAGLRDPSRRHPLCHLSDRELEVLSLIGDGLSSEQIARTLSLSPKTIESHRANLRRKLTLPTGPDLLRYAVARKFESLNPPPPDSAPPPEVREGP